jgi:hypothetical protein
MKKLLSIIFLVLFTSSSYAATPSLKDFTINKENTIYAKRNMTYFINQGYELVLQETRGIRTAYVLKKAKIMLVAVQKPYLKLKLVILWS